MYFNFIRVLLLQKVVPALWRHAQYTFLLYVHANSLPHLPPQQTSHTGEHHYVSGIPTTNMTEGRAFDQGFRMGHGPGGWRRPSSSPVVPHQPCADDDHDGFKSKRWRQLGMQRTNLQDQSCGEPRPCENPALVMSCHTAVGALDRSKLAACTGATSCPIRDSGPNQISETIRSRSPGRQRRWAKNLM